MKDGYEIIMGMEPKEYLLVYEEEVILGPTSVRAIREWLSPGDDEETGEGTQVLRERADKFIPNTTHLKK